MKSRTVLAAIAAAALALIVVPATAEAQTTTDVVIVHGLNLAGETEPGGSSVTVCADDEQIIADLTFGTITDALPLTTDTPLQIEVFAGAGVPCTNGGALIDDLVTPTGAAVALVATSVGGVAELTAFELDAECTDAGIGRLSALHASGDTGTVDVLVDGESADTLEFGESLDANLDASTYSVQVDVSASPVVGPVDVDVATQTNTLVVVVGNIDGTPPTPVVGLVKSFEIDLCEQPAAPTTSIPTTPTVVPPVSGTAAPISFTG